MDIKSIQEKVEIAKESAKELEDDLKLAAFKVILENLMKEDT